MAKIFYLSKSKYYLINTLNLESKSFLLLSNIGNSLSSFLPDTRHLFNLLWCYVLDICSEKFRDVLIVWGPSATGYEHGTGSYSANTVDGSSTMRDPGSLVDVAALYSRENAGRHSCRSCHCLPDQFCVCRKSKYSILRLDFLRKKFNFRLRVF